MQRGEIWFAGAPGGDRPVLVLTRDPVADRIGSVVVVALTRYRRGLVSELDLTAGRDGVPTDCVVNFDNVHTLARELFRGLVTSLSPARMSQAGRVLADAPAVDLRVNRWHPRFRHHRGASTTMRWRPAWQASPTWRSLICTGPMPGERRAPCPTSTPASRPCGVI